MTKSPVRTLVVCSSGVAATGSALGQAKYAPAATNITTTIVIVIVLLDLCDFRFGEAEMFFSIIQLRWFKLLLV
jgi:hypothetical protein